MSKQEIVKVNETLEGVFESEKVNLDSNSSKAKRIFNILLRKLPRLTAQDWMSIFEGMHAYETIGKVNWKIHYKVAVVDLLIRCAKQNAFYLAKDGSKIYVYNGNYWIEVDEEIIKQFLKLTAESLGVPKWMSIESVFIDDLYRQLQSAGFFEKMEHRDDTLLNLSNGTLCININGTKLEAFKPADFLTHQLDFEYDPTSKNDLWLRFLDEVLPDLDTQRTLQQALGYLLVQDLKLEKAVFLYGTGANGKSIVFEVLHGILNHEIFTNYSLESLTNSSGYHRTNLNNKLINYGTDISMKKIDHGIFKQLVSGEPIEVRQIYEKPFIMKKYAKLIFNLNKIDDADVETTVGFFRRMVFIPFEVTIAPENQDKMLHKKLLKNKSGILNWLLEGIEEVVKNQEIFISKQCKDFLENFRNESNLAIRFIQNINLIQSASETIRFQVMYERFQQFCEKQGERSWTQRIFNNELKKLGFQSTRKSDGFYWFAKTTSFYTTQ